MGGTLDAAAPLHHRTYRVQARDHAAHRRASFRRTLALTEFHELSTNKTYTGQKSLTINKKNPTLRLPFMAQTSRPAFANRVSSVRAAMTVDVRPTLSLSYAPPLSILAPICTAHSEPGGTRIVLRHTGSDAVADDRSLALVRCGSSLPARQRRSPTSRFSALIVA